MNRKATIYLIISILVSSICFTACSPSRRMSKRAQKFIKRHQYDLALDYGVKLLASYPSRKYRTQAREIIRVLHPVVVEEHLKNIQHHEEKMEHAAHEERIQLAREISGEYERLDKINSILSAIPQEALYAKKGNDLNLHLFDYQKDVKISYDKIQDEKEKAAQFYYEKGIEFAEKGNHSIEYFIDAAKSFQKAQQFVPNFKNAKELEDKAYESAKIKIGITPFTNTSNYKTSDAQKTLETFQLYFSEELTNNNGFKSNDFEIYLERDLKKSVRNDGMVSRELKPQMDTEGDGFLYYLTGNISQIIIDTTHISSKSELIEKQVMTSVKEYTDNEGNKRREEEWQTVNGKIIEHFQKISITIVYNFTINDTKNQQLELVKTVTKHVDKDLSWLSFEGNEQALSSEMRQKIFERKKPLHNILYLSLETSKEAAKDLTKAFENYIRAKKNELKKYR